jgi:mitochondrial fission protein ELM1
MIGGPAVPVPEPVVWLLLGDKRGDNAQVLALGQALGWRIVIKQLHYIDGFRVPYRRRGASLAGVDLDRSAPLIAPWPDVIIGIGQRSASTSRWIKHQSGDHALNIRLGRPRTSLRHFDLVISTLQYGLAKSARTMLLTLPLTRADEPELSQTTIEWQDSFAQLPRPWTTVLIGGKNTRLRLDRAVMGDLVDSLSQYHAEHGGSLLLTTSPRTPRTAGDRLQELAAQKWREIPHFLFRWTPDISNPYKAMIAGADRVIVTNDTVSMVADAAAMAKPLSVYELPPKTGLKKAKFLRPFIRRFCNWLALRQESGRPVTLLDICYNYLTNTGIIRPPRNIPIVFARLNRLGAIKPLGERSVGLPMAAMTMTREQAAVVRRIRRMLAERYGIPVDHLPTTEALAPSAASA